jgi:cell division protein FtsW
LAAILGILSILTTWRIERLYFFFKPEDNLTGGAMQADMAHKAFISGGLFGHGLGHGIYKLGRISLVHSDYIFATVGEELGLIGALFVIMLFVILLWLTIRISRAYYYSEYEKLLLVSLSLIIVFQAFFPTTAQNPSTYWPNTR